VVGRQLEQALSHLRLVASHAGFWELRALQRLDGTHMAARGSFFIIATQSGEDLIYDRLEHAAQWANEHASHGAELFIGMNPREREAKGKDAVSVLTSCYVDLDLPEGESQEEALAAVTSGDVPLPSFVVNSGYGLHVVYLLREPTADKALWKQVQRGLVHRLSDLGADRSVAPDESRVLRLIPFPNRKRWPRGIATLVAIRVSLKHCPIASVKSFNTTCLRGCTRCRSCRLQRRPATTWCSRHHDYLGGRCAAPGQKQ